MKVLRHVNFSTNLRKANASAPPPKEPVTKRMGPSRSRSRVSVQRRDALVVVQDAAHGVAAEAEGGHGRAVGSPQVVRRRPLDA